MLSYLPLQMTSHVGQSGIYCVTAAGAGSTSALIPAIPFLLDMVAQTQTPVSLPASYCLATLTEMFPQDAASGILSGDGLLLIADGLQQAEQQEGSSESERDESEDASKLRKQHLLTSLVIACRFQPSANIMAGKHYQEFTVASGSELVVKMC